MNSGTKCCLFLCGAPALTAAVSGVAAFNTWVGGLILQSAGWAPAAVSHLPAVSAVGAATIAGPLLCCITAAVATTDESISIEVNGGMVANAIGSAIYSSTGAAIFGWGGAKLGFAAAAGAIGGVVGTAALGFGVLGAICCCKTIFVCCRSNDSEETFFVQMPRSVRSHTAIMPLDLQHAMAQNGTLASADITNGLAQAGLGPQADAFRVAQQQILNGNNNYLPQQPYYPSMK